MQYIYTECHLPSNGKLYDTQVIHLRPKTIFDIKMLLSNPIFMLKSEIDALQNCIDPRDSVNVYDLVSEDVVFLLYKLRSLSDDCLNVQIKGTQYPVKISELEVKNLENWEHIYKLPDSGWEVILAYRPIKNVFEAQQQQNDFLSKYPDFNGDVVNTVALLNAIDSIDDSVNKDHIRCKLEQLSWKDSIYLIDKIEKSSKLDFGVKEEVVLEIEGEKVTVPLQITEGFFRPTINS